LGDIEFWVVFVIENSIKLQKMGLEGNFSWATCSHLSQIVAQVTLVYLLKKVVCFVCHIEISQITLFLMMFLVSLESRWWVWVHQGCLVVFRLMVQELLNIEHFFQRNLKTIKTKYFREIGTSTLVLLESTYGWDFFGSDFIIFRMKVREILNID
jgi:hypothetical protein